MTPGERWHNFWFQEQSNRPLCLLRLVMGVVFVVNRTVSGGLEATSQLKLRLPMRTFDTPASYFLDVYRLPVPGLDWLPVPTYTQFYYIDWAFVVLGVLFTLGLGFRVVGPALALLYAYCFLLSQYNYYHHVQLMVLTLLVLGFAPSAQHYSLDALLLARGKPRPPRSVLPIRLLQFTVTILYLFTFLAKCNHGWWTGRIIEVFQSSKSIDQHYGPLVLGYVSPRFLSLFTLFVEGFLVFALWIPRVRWLAIALGVALHIGIDLLMNIRTFSLQMFALYILFAIPSPRKPRLRNPPEPPGAAAEA